MFIPPYFGNFMILEMKNDQNDFRQEQVACNIIVIL